MTKFNVGDKVVPISKTVCWRTYDIIADHLEESKVWKNANSNNQKYLYVNSVIGDDKYTCGDEAMCGGDFFTECDLIPYKKVSKNQRITALENEVTELKLIVHELRGRPQLTTVVNNINGPSTINTVEDKSKIRGITIEIGKPKSPNEQRAQIIEDAKKFVEQILGPFDTFLTTIGKYENQSVRPKFHVNEKKRAVTVLIYGAFGKRLYFKGIAKCKPSDVFNEHIGKAIALGRALNIDVSKFEQAVQPTEIVNGAIYENVYIDGTINYREEANVGLNFEYVNEKLEHGRRGTFNHTNHNARIINDTNAQYGGVE